MQTKSETIIAGRVTGVYGVKGWLKVHSYTRPAENLLNYSPWWLSTPEGCVRKHVLDSGIRGKVLIALLEELNDREQASKLVHTDILIAKADLPELPPGEHYWHEIVGLKVIDTNGRLLGIIQQVMETGGNDVLVVEGEDRYLIPWVRDEYVIDVDLESGFMRVDWHGTI
ncbi:MAG: ribosome maturation factor RimM [Gammaproteobacteria bacterium]|nr:ribosome maturation factor RimM [Gammaproteobacteria bacterium]